MNWLYYLLFSSFYLSPLHQYFIPMTIVNTFMLKLFPESILSEFSNHIQFPYTFDPWCCHLFSISHLLKKVYHSVFPPNLCYYFVKCWNEGPSFFQCQLLPRFNIHRYYGVASDAIFIPFDQVVHSLLMMLNLQHVFLLNSLHFHLLAFSSPVPIFSIHCILPVSYRAFMICHEVFLVVIQFTFESDFLRYLYNFFS